MKLREFLDIHKSTKSIHVEKYVKDGEPIRVALFQNISVIPEQYMESEVKDSRYRMEIDRLSKIVIVPVVVLDIDRGN